MKRFVLAGLFIILGFIILGAATANLMSGPDKPQKPHMAGPAPSDAHKTGGRGASQETNAVQPPQTNPKPVQPAAAPALLPGMPAPLTTTVPPPTIRPPSPEMSQHVPVIQPTDLGTPSSPTAGRQHQ